MQCLVLVVVTVTEVYSVAMVTSQVKVTRENVFSCHSNHQHGTGPTVIDQISSEKIEKKLKLGSEIFLKTQDDHIIPLFAECVEENPESI